MRITYRQMLKRAGFGDYWKSVGDRFLGTRGEHSATGDEREGIRGWRAAVTGSGMDRWKARGEFWWRSLVDGLARLFGARTRSDEWLKGWNSQQARMDKGREMARAVKGGRLGWWDRQKARYRMLDSRMTTGTFGNYDPMQTGWDAEMNNK